MRISIDFNDLLTPDEVAVRLHVQRNTLAVWRCSGKGPAFVKIGSKVLYPKSELKKWIDSNSEPLVHDEHEGNINDLIKERNELSEKVETLVNQRNVQALKQRDLKEEISNLRKQISYLELRLKGEIPTTTVEHHKLALNHSELVGKYNKLVDAFDHSKSDYDKLIIKHQNLSFENLSLKASFSVERQKYESTIEGLKNLLSKKMNDDRLFKARLFESLHDESDDDTIHNIVNGLETFNG